MSGQFLSGLALLLILVEIRLRCRRRELYTVARAAAVGFSFEVNCGAMRAPSAAYSGAAAKPLSAGIESGFAVRVLIQLAGLCIPLGSLVVSSPTAEASPSGSSPSTLDRSAPNNFTPS